MAWKKSFSAEERTAYRQQKAGEARERVEASVRELMSSEGWTRWVAARARFHDYSLGNTLLIAQQRPDATRVASFKAWQGLGRQVRKGEKAIRIMAPITVKVEDSSTGDVERRLFFKAVSVFDVSQTDGDDLPEPPHESIEGDTHSEYLEILERFAGELGFSVGYEDLGESIGGYCRAADKQIVVSSRKSVNGQVRTLVHELAHALGVDYTDYSRGDAEVIVETAAIIACGSIGLDTAGESVPYIAHWGYGDDLAAMKTFAGKVDECATRLEVALGAKSQRH